MKLSPSAEAKIYHLLWSQKFIAVFIRTRTALYSQSAESNPHPLIRVLQRIRQSLGPYAKFRNML
jgi:hypothetical protein